MELCNLFYSLLSFIVALLIAWVALSVTLIWLKPAFYNNDGSLNWGVTLWVAFIIILVTFLVMLIIWVIVYLFSHYFNSSCEPECKPACEIKEKHCGDMNMNMGMNTMGMKGLYKPL